MPKRSPPSRLVLKGILSFAGHRISLDAGDGPLTLELPNNVPRKSLRAGRLYYVQGVLMRGAVKATHVSLADALVASEEGEDHPRFAAVMVLLRSRRLELLGHPGVLDVRAGYLYVNGWTTKKPAIIVTYDPSKPKPQIPSPFSGVPLDLRVGTPQEQLLAADALTPQWVRDSLNVEPVAVPGWEERENAGPIAAGLQAATAKAAGRLKYVAPPGVNLGPINDNFHLTCHSSPDAGWPILDKFFGGVSKSLTIAMYDFTAPHIAKTLTATSKIKALTLVLDPGEALSAPGSSKAKNPKAFDEHEVTIVTSLRHTFGKRLSFAWAAVKRAGKTTRGIYPTAYHIKVAVSDGRTIWLSSGNWQSSNQPDFPQLSSSTPGLEAIFKTYNREWHVVATGTVLARLFETVIKWDRLQAAPIQVHPLSLALPEVLLEDDSPLAAAQPRVHAPQEFTGKYAIQPLLTPDNYLEHLSAAIQGAKRSIRIQNQYIKLPTRGGEAFIEFLKLLRAKAKQFKNNFKIIVRDLPGVQEQLEALEHFGFNMDQFKRQPNTHTKGVIIDDETLIIGSHNWSNQGVLENRDASLLLKDRKVAAFYAELFDHDWQVLARQAGSSAAAACSDPIQLNWSEYLE